MTRSVLHGVPEALTIDTAREWVLPRVSNKRFKHIEGVAEVAARLADWAGVEKFPAVLAGWLHDACKEVKDHELVQMAKQFGLILHPVEEENGHLLHGPVAACVAAKELHVSNKEILAAVSEHTLGAVGMSDLSKILFLADCLEESRPKDFTEPIWYAMGANKSGLKLIGDFDLDKAILVACDLSLAHLIESGRVIHPRTVDVRNYYLNLVRSRKHNH